MIVMPYVHLDCGLWSYGIVLMCSQCERAITLQGHNVAFPIYGLLLMVAFLSELK